MSHQVSEDGNREERCWKDGLLDGPAIVEGVNGDRLEFNYKQGVSKIFSEALNINSAVEDLVYYEGERRECNLQICRWFRGGFLFFFFFNFVCIVVDQRSGALDG